MPEKASDPRFSVDGEPWQRKSGFTPDFHENTASGLSRPNHDDTHFRDSVFSEPAHTGSNGIRSEFQQWFKAKQADTSITGNLSATLLAAVIAGPFALLGAVLAGRQTGFFIVYLVLVGPIVEELLKQSGMVFLVERMPYRLFSPLQFVFAAAVAGLCFAVFENLVYIHVLSAHASESHLQVLSDFRWTVCTSLHVLCSIIASLGLIRVWRQQQLDGKPANLSHAFPYFAAAIAVHGTYNLIALLTNSYIFVP